AKVTVSPIFRPLAFGLHAPAISPTIPPPRAVRDGTRGHPILAREDRMSLDHSASATPVRRLLVALVATVCAHPRLVLSLALGLCLASAVAAVSCLKYHTSRNDLISARKDYQQRWQKYLAEFGDDDDIVVVVQGSNRPRMKAALDTVAKYLQAVP